ncbi:photosystem reaction center subunit H [Anaerobacillus alkaliphilus]|uniref:Photosystem reaction center subunit H n=1 Tax=Anaerobacillus alkaliphilus TaxID=1548597 RepID=A0A4Q0VQ73_9BACI|nr:PRC-barrel domain-containing protein [Anaerobacillus alkaliphilus]RXI98418.1 photosystem reaction center subunit H [Anaerobacillus alkaliphilus]
MKTSKQIIGLPIISINDGKELGTVKSLVVNPDQGTVDFITIHHEDWQVSVKAIPFKKVIGVGDYALTVESEMNIIDLTEIPIANQLVTKNIKVIGARMMTKKGQLLGQVTELYVNDDNGSIVSLELSYNNEHVFLSSNQVLTFGKDILIVNEDADQYFMASVDEIHTGSQRNEEVEFTPELEGEEEDLSQTFLERQISLLEGKKVTEDIYSKNGDLLIKEGTVLTKDVIMAVHNDGPSGMVSLSMNVENE